LSESGSSPFPPPDTALVDACLAAFVAHLHTVRVFGNGVREFFSSHPELNAGDPPPIHSVRSRAKDPEHLREKIVRKKVRENRDITPDNLLEQVTDLFGVRVLHIYLQQVVPIHNAIKAYVNAGHLAFFEEPKAYTWDPETKAFLEGLGLRVIYKENHYTSIHYVVKPNPGSRITCEIQVRSLFEEAWAEIDHVLNYPNETSSIACREQLRVMAKMMGAGSRLAEAIFRSHHEHHSLKARPDR
jgi:ppGpp synthetase/RelA/SpoT-type nucleotidyltranferase